MRWHRANAVQSKCKWPACPSVRPFGRRTATMQNIHRRRADGISLIRTAVFIFHCLHHACQCNIIRIESTGGYTGKTPSNEINSTRTHSNMFVCGIVVCTCCDWILLLLHVESLLLTNIQYRCTGEFYCPECECTKTNSQLYFFFLHFCISARCRNLHHVDDEMQKCIIKLPQTEAMTTSQNIIFAHCVCVVTPLACHFAHAQDW